ncbi:MAG TPA: polysaccharide biosynthesis/export family protein [Terracidiphilus sp.]|nr:polysaccharide biosynthesis/export family protein [Terracidiphilus sp.]
MMHKLFHATLVAAAFQIVLQYQAVAQINVQQVSNLPSQGSHGEGQAGIASGSHATGLGLVPEDFSKLRLAPGFLVELKVLDDTDFDGNFRIDEDGYISVPILGTVHVAGETASEAQDQIKQVLRKEQILNDPQVALNVLEYTAPQVTIVGEVGSPGKYPLLVPRKLVDVLAMAGGPNALAGNEVSIVRGSGGSKPVLVHYSKSTDPGSVADVMVYPGDTVQVKRAGIVYVLGAVNRPGGYVMQEDGTLNLLQAISLANGTSAIAKTSTIYLLRRDADGTEVDISLPYKKISHGKLANFELHATDIVFVPTSGVKSALTNSQMVLTSAASAAIYKY